MGEIGISIHDYYYELRWWELQSIIRGYNKRHHSCWEQARLVAYNARFCMGSAEQLPTITQWIKFPWESQDAGDNEPELSDADVEDMQRKMREWNEQHAAE